MILASSSKGDIVIDPFVGSGNTCRVSQILGRKWVGIDINPAYIEMTKTRISKPYDGFDSYDPRTERTPRDLPSITANKQMVFLEEHGSSHSHFAHKSTQGKQ